MNLKLWCRLAYPSQERFALSVLTLLAFALRLWDLPAKGLSYDEAATALMARATPLEIIQFHWTAAFEHLPLWILLMHGWSALAGQSEAALRLVPAFAGALTIPLFWATLRKFKPFTAGARLLSLSLVAFSTTMLYYSQEARMYTLVVLLGVASVHLSLMVAEEPRSSRVAGFVLVNWAMVGFQYFSILLIAVEAIFYTIVTLHRRTVPHRILALLATACVISGIPFLLWARFSPGFHETLTVVLHAAATDRVTWNQFLGDMWRNLAFGAFRWQPSQSWLGFLLAPLVVLGAVDALRTPFLPRIAATGEYDIYRYWGWLSILIIALPLLIGTLMLRTLSARYILYILPYLYGLAALGIWRLWKISALLGISGLGLAMIVALVGIGYYFGPYQKSEYREMAAYLSAHIDAGHDAVLLEAPRQHLLTKYYLDHSLAVFPIPPISLPAYWPVTAPPVVPEDLTT